MAHLENISAVIFDMDDLLLDTERVYFDCFRIAMDRHGLRQDDSIFLRMVGTNRALGRRILSEGLARRVSLEDFDTIWDAEIATRFARGVPVKPGVREVVTAIRARDLPYMIATSTRTERAHQALTRAGLSDLFPNVIGGDQVANGKPAPDIYLAAARSLGHAPAQCVAFEDSANGVRAAHAAGCLTVQIPGVVPPDPDLLTLGHLVSPDLLAGAKEIGFFDLASSHNADRRR